MPQYRAFLQTLGAVVLLALALACHGKSSSSGQPAGTANISGTLTYSRVPLATDTQGVPTGLVDATVAANLKSLPARGVSVRFYQQLTQTHADGSTSLVWVFVASSTTDVNGAYVATLPLGNATMVELLSTFDAGNGAVIHLIAEPLGINSSTPALSRLQFAQRKAANGTAATASNNAPSSMLQANATVDFTIGLNDEWWLVNPEYSLVGGNKAPNVDQALLETSYPGRTPGNGTGSRVLGIGDTIASFRINYGSAAPGSFLDLHYWPGRSEARGSFIEYDQSVYPQAYDSSNGIIHYFGSLSGGANDDAWDEGVIMPLLARNILFASNSTRTFATPSNRLFPQGVAQPDLSPDLARIEGLAEAMAANLLKSPYLGDTQGTTLAAPVRDVRNVSSLSSAQKSPYSAPALRAFAWEIILKANNLPSPGNATNWATINPLATSRFFLAPSGGTNTSTNINTFDSEPLNIFSQIARLSETKSASEPVDLATVLPTAVVATLGTPFGISWPRPTSGPYASFAAFWGADPVTPFPSVPLSMAKGIQVNGSYPNYSQGEVFYAGFSLNADKRCVLSATIAPVLPAGAKIDVDLPLMNQTFSFTGIGGSTPVIVIPVPGTTPYYHPIRLRLKSPSTLQPDVMVTLTLTPAP